MHIGEKITLRVDRLSLGGDAIGRAEGAVVFVPYGSPGDMLEIELIDVRRNFARGKLLRVIEESPVRQEPPCPYHFHVVRHAGVGMRDAGGGSFNKEQPSPTSHVPRAASGLFCGGCSWQHMNYPFQLDAKRQLVQETLERIGGVREVEVKDTLGMKDPWRYRNKVQQPVGWDGDRAISGFYSPGSHDIVPIVDCLVQPELSVSILNRARDLLKPRHRGWLRHLLVRTAQGQALLVFVTQREEFPHESEMLGSLSRAFPQLVGVHQNVNPGKTNVILGRHWRKLAGADYLEERLGQLKFRLSPGSFFQVNPSQTEVLYNVIKEAIPSPHHTLLDLYCGVGSISLWLADRFKEVIGVDEVPGAIADAKLNASLNNIKNASFFVSTSEHYLGRLTRAGQSLTVVLDPPRSGCHPGVLTRLARLRPSRLIYVSCDPGTLARDLGILCESGYQIDTIQPVDLFPHTPHIEVVVGLHFP